MFQPRDKPILYLDTETFSTVDIKTAGTVKYAESAELLLAGFLLEGKYHVYDYAHDPIIPNWVLDHILSGGTVCAHNALFDFVVLRKHLPSIQIEQMLDSMAVCAAHSLPMALGKVTPILNLDTQKYTDGSKLVRRFCTPRKPTKYNKSKRTLYSDDPDGWEEFKNLYLVQDIYSMQELIEELGILTPTEQQYWVDTQIINLGGIPVDILTTSLIQDKIATLVDEESTKFIRLTGVFPTQRDRVLGWVRTQGVKVLNLQAATVAEILEDKDTPEIVVEALTARANTTHMSFKKYDTIINAAMDDDTVRGTLMYHAAHTGRWGGRLLQPQNLTKGSIDALEAVDRIQKGEFSVELVKSALRAMIAHPDGFTIVDYTQIEARITQWLCKDEEALAVFTSGVDPYVVMATRIYGTDDIDELKRFVGKQAVLGLGFQMAAPKFKAQAASFGIEIDIELAEHAVKVYRKLHKKLKTFWSNINKAACMAVDRPDLLIKCNEYIAFICEGDFLYMLLPSGRRIAYYQPTIGFNAWDQPNLNYMDINEKHQWVRVHTFGGKLTENAVQAIARDILAKAVSDLIECGFTVITHIHDEVVIQGMEKQADIESIITHVPTWAEGMPIDVKGFISPRFKKV